MFSNILSLLLLCMTLGVVGVQIYVDISRFPRKTNYRKRAVKKRPLDTSLTLAIMNLVTILRRHLERKPAQQFYRVRSHKAKLSLGGVAPLSMFFVFTAIMGTYGLLIGVDAVLVISAVAAFLLLGCAAVMNERSLTRSDKFSLCLLLPFAYLVCTVFALTNVSRKLLLAKSR